MRSVCTGLSRSFGAGHLDAVIYCSAITAALLIHDFGIPAKRVRALPMDQAVVVDGVRVTLIDANHVRQPHPRRQCLLVCLHLPGAAARALLCAAPAVPGRRHVPVRLQPAHPQSVPSGAPRRVAQPPHETWLVLFDARELAANVRERPPSWGSR